jgi:hypothetical protein
MSFTTPPTDPIVQAVTDVVLKLILQTPELRVKLNELLKEPSRAFKDINAVYVELQHQLTPADKTALAQYLVQPFAQHKLIVMFVDAFEGIMADGKIDLSDSLHFMALVHKLVTLFNTFDANNTVTLSTNSVLYFLYFLTKSVLLLTLEGEHERMALLLLDQSFQLIQLTVTPVLPKTWKWKCCGRWPYHKNITR